MKIEFTEKEKKIFKISWVVFMVIFSVLTFIFTMAYFADVFMIDSNALYLFSLITETIIVTNIIKANL